MRASIPGMALALLAATTAQASDPSSGLKQCLELKGSTSDRLACYDALAQKLEDTPYTTPPRPAASAPSAKSRKGFELDREWTPNPDKFFSAYQQNYMLVFEKSSHPNSAPTSSNPLNQVPYTYTLDNKESKFQVSLKSDVFDISDNDSLWIAYTQQSFWQMYDASHSRPFRESNYEPELIYSHRMNKAYPIMGLTPRMLNFGFLHQSNGQSLPRSRSWNRVYVQAGLERDFGERSKLAVLVRPWVRVKEKPADDDNPDITHYLGYADVVVRYWGDQTVYALTARIRSLQLDWDFRIPGLNGLNMHVQYFTGYGESLIDYNQRHDALGVGFSLPYE